MGVNFDSPPLPAWAEAAISNGMLYQWDFTNPENGRRASALIVVSGMPGNQDDPATLLPVLMDSAGLLVGERTTQEHKGITTSGQPMAWAMRAGSTHTNPSSEIVVAAIAFRAPEGIADAMLILVNVDGAHRDTAETDFDEVVQSLYMGATPRPALPAAQAGSESLDGLYIYTVTNFVQNPMGGTQMTMVWKLRQFDPSGLYADRPPLGNETLASLCAATPGLCGTYRLNGATIETASVQRFGLVETESVAFEQTERGFKIGRYPYEPARPVPGPTLNGSWRFNYYSGGPRGSVSVIRQIDFTADGRYVKTGFTGATTTDPVNGISTTSSGTDPEQSGRYAIDGFTLTFTSYAGTTEQMSLVATDPADLSFVFIDGDSYARVEK
ncbi:hypothetical protein sos41_29800 [Alphaproteobacteria bacterium SO-S41]|nr:hypothetical protein sos41_29800 [Alphaproteobacteria bacterium SO-S41]